MGEPSKWALRKAAENTCMSIDHLTTRVVSYCHGNPVSVPTRGTEPCEDCEGVAQSLDEARREGCRIGLEWFARQFGEGVATQAQQLDPDQILREHDEGE